MLKRKQYWSAVEFFYSALWWPVPRFCLDFFFRLQQLRPLQCEVCLTLYPPLYVLLACLVLWRVNKSWSEGVTLAFCGVLIQHTASALSPSNFCCRIKSNSPKKTTSLPTPNSWYPGSLHSSQVARANPYHPEKTLKTTPRQVCSKLLWVSVNHSKIDSTKIKFNPEEN